jgi:hypothetical protein
MTKISKLQLSLGDLFISDPEKELGPNWETVLNFWLFLDSLSSDHRKLIGERYNELERSGRLRGHYEIVCQYVGEVLENEGRLWNKVYRGRNFTFNYNLIDYNLAVTWATHELVGMHELIEAGKEIHILPLFDCATS